MQKNSFRRVQQCLSDVIYLLQSRRLGLLRAARGYLLFHLSRLVRSIPWCGVPNLILAENVRLQRNSSVLCAGRDTQITLGANSIIYEDARLEAYGSGVISVGAGSIVGACRIVARYSVEIGERFLCSWNVFVQDFDSHPVEQTVRRVQMEKMTAGFRPSYGRMPSVDLGVLAQWNFPGEPITIGDDVWIGANVTILKGARIGDGCVIATGSVVLRGEYPTGSLIAGNPAKILKKL